MPTIEAIKHLDKDQIKQVSKKLAKALVFNFVVGVVGTVAVTLAAGAILAAVAPSNEAAE